MADRWEVRAAGRSSAPDHGGRAFARRGFAVALPALLAFAGVRCFQDLLVEPSQPAYAFSITPDSADVAIGDTVAPYRGTLTADGQPIGFWLGLAVTAGQDVIRVDSLGRIVALKRGVARLTARPLVSAFTSDTLQRHVTLRAIVPRLGVVASPSVDTLTSLGDTLVLRAAALTRAGDTIPGVPIVWRRVSGDTVAALLDSTAGRIRAERNGAAEFVAVVDTATARRRVVVQQVPVALVLPDSVRVIALGPAAQLPHPVRDRRGNPIIDATVAWTSLDPGVCTVSGAGLVTATANGICRVEARIATLVDTTRAIVEQVARRLRRVLVGDSQTGQVGTTLPLPLTAQVLDSLGAEVQRAGEAVRFVVREGGGKLSGQDSRDTVSNASGRASATLTLPTVAGSQKVAALLPSVPDSVVLFTATALPGPARTLALVSGSDQSGLAGAPLAAPFVVAVQDTFGNAIGGRSVTFKVTRGGGKLGGQDSVVVATNAQGRASAVLTLGTVPDTNQVSVMSGGLAGSPLTFTAIGTVVPPVAAQIAAGLSHTCGLTTGGAAYCWGSNISGQLGDGTGIDRLSPTAVSGGLVFQAISAGWYHTCGLTTGGAAYCWGRNSSGELGDGTTGNRTSPVAVSGGLVFQAISTGYGYTCGLTTGGAAYCWGDNYAGQLGDGTTSQRTSPVAVSGGLVFIAVSAHMDHTCGLTAYGAAYCWGRNDYCQLGDGTTSRRTSPVAVSWGLVFQALSTGALNTCGLTTGGAAYCWGSDSVASRAAPGAVFGGLVIQAISTGDLHTCGLTAGGAAYCGGNNAAGQLGFGGSPEPRFMNSGVVSGGLVFHSISAGSWYTCGITTGGAAYCWGSNNYGQLGDGTSTDRTSPVTVVGGIVFGAPGLTPAGALGPRLRAQ